VKEGRMRPTPAEVARTLAGGRLPGIAHVAGHPGRLRVRHVTPGDGDPLLLAAVDTEVAAALRPGRIVLAVDDVPPVMGAPSRGRLWLTGAVARLHGTAALAAADAYAEVNATGDLLDVGHGHALFRLTTDEVRVANGRALVEVDPADFRAAAPDPLAGDEGRLLADLNDHHRAQLTALLERVTERSAPPDCRALRIDRYGLTIGPGHAGPRIRLGFPRPVATVCEVTHLVHALLWSGGVGVDRPAVS